MFLDIDDNLPFGHLEPHAAFMHGGGLRDEDKPLQPCLTLRDADALAAAVGFGAPRSKVHEAICTVLANLIRLVQTGGGEWVFYSRDNNHYAATARYAPKFYRRSIMIEAVNRLVDAGLVLHLKTRPSPSARLRSRIRPTSQLRAMIETLPARATVLMPCEVIVLRDEDGMPMPYRETAKTSAMRRDLIEHNAFLGKYDISLDHAAVHRDAQGFIVVGDQRIDPDRTVYYRVFNDSSFARGGRWFGPWWQSLPSRVRDGIRIDGEPTREPDIQGCHIRLLCARAGVKLGDGDPYAGFDLPRGEVKLAVNIMLNARSWPSARGALIGRLEDVHGSAAGRRAHLLRAALHGRFPELQAFWNSRYGLVLQNVDASICMHVQRRLRQDGVPSLSIHDSFRVPLSAVAQVVELMAQELDRACHRLRKQSTKH